MSAHLSFQVALVLFVFILVLWLYINQAQAKRRNQVNPPPDYHLRNGDHNTPQKRLEIYGSWKGVTGFNLSDSPLQPGLILQWGTGLPITPLKPGENVKVALLNARRLPEVALDIPDELTPEVEAHIAWTIYTIDQALTRLAKGILAGHQPEIRQQDGRSVYADTYLHLGVTRHLPITFGGEISARYEHDRQQQQQLLDAQPKGEPN